jgi:hypothetical protein
MRAAERAARLSQAARIDGRRLVWSTALSRLIFRPDGSLPAGA